MPIVLAIREVEARGLLEPKSLQPMVGEGRQESKKEGKKTKRKKGEARNERREYRAHTKQS